MVRIPISFPRRGRHLFVVSGTSSRLRTVKLSRPFLSSLGFSLLWSVRRTPATPFSDPYFQPYLPPPHE